MNEHEIRARAAKVDKLVTHLADVILPTAVARHPKVWPVHRHQQLADLATFVRVTWGDDEWSNLAIAAGVGKPSEETRRLVLRGLSIRANAAAAEALGDDSKLGEVFAGLPS